MDTVNSTQDSAPSCDQQLYQPLDSGRFQIRLLSLSPGAFQDPITGSIKVAFLDESPRYAALSYVWGHDLAPSPMTLGQTPTSITQNLDTALRHLRHQALNKLFWVDAICINQADLKEKAEQVGRMGLIYSKAHKVIVWLGSADASFEPVETFLRDLDERREYLRSFASELKAPGPRRSKTRNDPEFSLALREHHRPTSVLRGLLQLLSRPYWERVWIIQEISKASNVEVRFGQLRVHLNPLLLASRNLKNLSERTQTLLTAIIKFRAQEQSYGGFSPNARMSLFDALITSRYSLATDPRDKIYALLGMTCDGINLVPLTTYASTVEAVFHDLTSAIIKHQQPSNILLLANWAPARERFTDASRWCIDWADLGYHLPPWLTKVERSRIPAMAIPSQFDFDGSELVTKGRRVGSLKQVEGTLKKVSPASPTPIRRGKISDGAQAADVLKQLTSDLLHRLAPTSKSTTPLSEIELTDALARMIRDVNKGKTSANYDMNCVEDVLDRLGEIMYESNPVWEWARLYNSFRADEECNDESTVVSIPSTRPSSKASSPASSNAPFRLAVRRKEQSPPYQPTRGNRKSTLDNMLKRPTQDRLQTPPRATNASPETILSPRPSAPSLAAFQFWEDVFSVIDAAPEYKLRFALAQFTRTEEHLVLVCQDARAGDQIFQIEHSNLPVLLRRRFNRFDFIGDVCLGRQDTGEWSRHRFNAPADDDPFDPQSLGDAETLHVSLEGTFLMRKASYGSLYDS